MITCGPEVRFPPEEIEASKLYRQWLAQFGPEWVVEGLHVHVALRWKGEIRMMFGQITAVDAWGRRNTTVALLRGATVEVLPVIVAPDGTEYVVFVEQSRNAVGEMVVSEPAGMKDNNPADIAVLKELDEEVGGGIVWSAPVWLNHFATGSDAPMLSTPGGEYEEVLFGAVFAHLDEGQMHALAGSIAGLEDEHEQTKIHVVVLARQAMQYLARNGRRPDMKTVLNLFLFHQSRQVV